MSSHKPIPQAVRWHEGMQLESEHLTHSFDRQDRLSEYYYLQVSPYGWGLKQLEFDEDLLNNGTLLIQRLVAILPDGRLIDWTADSRKSGSLMGKETELKLNMTPFQKIKDNEKGELITFVETNNLNEPSLHGEFDTIQFPLNDIDDVRFANVQPTSKIQLIVGASLSPEYMGFPILKIGHGENGYHLTPFIPPTLIISDAPELIEKCWILSNDLRKKAALLQSEITRILNKTDRALTFEYREKIRCLLSALPPFENHLLCDNLHPFELYQSLLNVVSAVSLLAPVPTPPKLNGYRHNNLLETFDEAFKWIRQIVGRNIPEKYLMIPFKQASLNHGFSLLIEEQWNPDRLILGVRGERGATRQEVHSWMESCLIASSPFVTELQKKRISGIQREYIESLEGLTPLSDVLLFQLDIESPFFQLNDQLVILNTLNEQAHYPKMEELILLLPHHNQTI